MEPNDSFYRNVLQNPTIDSSGYYDIIAHGSPNSIEMNINGQRQVIDHRMLASMLEHSDDYMGQDIRLLSCSTGSLDDGFAQNLANKMNVNVLAPTDILWAYNNGAMVVASSTTPGRPLYPDLSNTGDFKLFTPGH